MTFVILALAVWRVARLITTENGPANVFTKLRIRLGAEPNAQGVWSGDDGTLSDWISCSDCFSVGLGIFVWAMYCLSPTFVIHCSVPFALSAISVLIRRNL